MKEILCSQLTICSNTKCRLVDSLPLTSRVDHVRVLQSQALCHSARINHSSHLEAVGRDLVADLGVILWKVDDQISGECSALSVGGAEDLEHGWLSASSVHAPGLWRHGEGWMRVSAEGCEVVLEGHANWLAFDGQDLA